MVELSLFGRDQVQICENLRSDRGWGKMPLSMRRKASHSGEPSVLKFQKTLQKHVSYEFNVRLP
jgi:hypothetical protein